jgi:hypothetical protein
MKVTIREAAEEDLDRIYAWAEQEIRARATEEMSNMSEQRTKQQEVDRNLAFFEQKLPELMKTHRSKYALIRNQEIVGFYDTVVDAQMTGAKFFADGLFSVQQVNDTPIDLGYYSHAVPMAKT